MRKELISKTDPQLFISEKILLGFLLLLTWAFIPLLGDPFSIKWMIAALGMCSFFALSLGKDICFGKSLPLLLVSGFLLSALVSAVGASNTYGALGGFGLLFLALGLFLVGATGSWSKGFSKSFSKVLIWAAIPVSILGIAQYFGQYIVGDSLSFGLQALGKMRVFSTLGNSNFLSCFLVMALPFAFVNMKHDFKKAVIPFALICGCIILSRSISGFLAVSVMAGVFFFSKYQLRLRYKILLGLPVLTLALVYGLMQHTGRGRILIWMESFLIWSKNILFGVGQGGFNISQMEAQAEVFSNPMVLDIFDQNASFILSAHNEYINTLVEQGLVGFASFALIIFIIFKKSKMSSPYYYAWIGPLVFFLWNAPLSYPAILVPFWIISGILYSQTGILKTRFSSQSIKTNRAAAYAFSALVPLVFMGLVFQTWSGLEERQGDLLVEKGPFPAAVAKYENAIRFSPQNGYLLEKLAIAHFFNDDFPSALAALNQAKPLFGDVGIQYLEAEIIAKQGELLESSKILEKISRSFPNHITPPFMLGQIYMKLGRVPEAIKSYYRVLDIPVSKRNLKLNRKKVQLQKRMASEFLFKWDPKEP